MVETLSPSPLPRRKQPPRPLQDWLWAEHANYDGLLLPDHARTAQAVRQYGPHLKSLRRVGDMMCLEFAAPVALDPRALGPALPLKKTPGAGWASFDISALKVPLTKPNTLHIVQGGTHQTFDLRHAEPIDPVSFWDVSKLDVTRSIPLTTKPVAPQNLPDVPVATAAAQIIKRTTDDPLFEDIQDAIEAAPDTPLNDWAGDLGRWLARMIVGLFVVGVIVLILTGLVGGGFGPMLAKLLVGFVVIVVMLLLFGGEDDVRPVQHRTQPQHAPLSAPRGPGFFERMLNWAKWQTPWGDKLRRDLEKHINDTAKMIAAGEIDKALKHALALGAAQAAEDKKRGMGMAQIPKPRGTLDLDFSGFAGSSSAILSGAGYSSITAQYQELAKQLSKDGDHRRAAFVYAELLSNVPSALEELEKIKAYTDAAKLATARKQPGHIAARLWFLAGEKDVALSIAQRADALGYIAHIAQDRDPAFAAFLRGHWIESLVAAGDLAAAVKESRGHPALTKLHQAVVQQAVLAGMLDDPDVFLSATVTLPWSVDAMTPAFVQSSADATGMVAAQINRAVIGRDTDDVAQRHVLIQGLGQQAAKRNKASSSFWDKRAPILGDALIRAVLGYDVNQRGAPSLDTLSNSAKALGLDALHEDLRHIRRKTPKKNKRIERFAISAPARNAHVWDGAICVLGGRSLLWTNIGEIALFDPQGDRLWTGQVPDLVGTVPIGTGRLVILIQGPVTRRRISIFDTRTCSQRYIGETQLITWHTSAKATSWAVQTPEAIGALDVAKMLDETPEFTLLWSMTQTVPLAVLAYKENDTQTSWMTQRVEVTGVGLIENWRYDRSLQQLYVTVADPINDQTRALHTEPHLWVGAGHPIAADQSLDAGALGVATKIRFQTYTHDLERHIIQNNQDFFVDLAAFARVTAVEGDRPCVAHPKGAAQNEVSLESNNLRSYASIGTTHIKTQNGSQDGKHLVFIDADNRVVRCDFRRGDVRVIGLS